MGVNGRKVGFILNLACDEKRDGGCNISATFSAENLTRAIKRARDAGWCVSKDKTRCYCPKHAAWNRSVGCLGCTSNSKLYYTAPTTSNDF